MSIRVKSFLKDVGGAGRVTEARREKLKNASAVPDPKDPIRDLADKLHPSEMQLRVTDIRDASPTAKTFRFEAVDGHIPVFQCGQFVNFRLKIGESLLTRPYTISSAPYEARGEHPFFEITVRRNVPYLVPDYFFENVHVGDVLTGALPFGTFYWEPLRRFRHDVVNNPADISTLPGYPKGTEEKTFRITVVRGIHEDVIDARASESVAVALERSAIPVDTHCRNGACGFCRSQLLGGDIFVSPIGDGRRAMDKELGWFHACSAYPLSDLKIKIPIM